MSKLQIVTNLGENPNGTLLREGAGLNPNRPEGVGCLPGENRPRTSTGAMTLKKLSYQHMWIAHLFALGLRNNEVVIRSGFTDAWVSTLKADPLMETMIEQERQRLYANDPEATLRLSLPKALRAYDEILDDPQASAKLRLSAANSVWDRTMGKPIQRLETADTTVSDLFKTLSQMASVRETPPEPANGVSAPSENKMTIDVPSEVFTPRSDPVPNVTADSETETPTERSSAELRNEDAKIQTFLEKL